MDERTGVRYVTGLAPAAWIRERLHPFAQDAGSVVPEAFDAYARAFHPAGRDGDTVKWRAIAEANGRTVHPEMQFGNIAGSWRDSPRPDLWTSPPRSGTLSPNLARALVDVLRAHTTTPERCWFAVWEGWGGFDPRTPRFELPSRRYFLATGAIDAAASSVREAWVQQSPSMWWPDDRAWFVATEIDLDSTYVGGTKACIDALLAHPEIEAVRVRLSDGITIASDELNPTPPPTAGRGAPVPPEPRRPSASWRGRIPRFYRPNTMWAYSGEAAVVAPQPQPRRPLVRLVLYAVIGALLILVGLALYTAIAGGPLQCDSAAMQNVAACRPSP